MMTSLARQPDPLEHYENFPVASILLPARLRPAIHALYRFARHADDLADEGEASVDERIAALDALERELLGQCGPSPLVARLQHHCDRHGLPHAPLQALLSAFRQDAAAGEHGVRHDSRTSLLDYCTRSANPIGEVILRLFDVWNERTKSSSDAICSALQLLNFVQDLGIDWHRNRLYLPLDELHAAGLSESDVARAVECGRTTPALSALLADQTAAAVRLLRSGSALVRHVPWRLALELRAILGGGLRIAEQLRISGYDPLARRPVLGWRDSAALLRLAAGSTRVPGERAGGGRDGSDRDGGEAR